MFIYYRVRVLNSENSTGGFNIQTRDGTDFCVPL